MATERPFEERMVSTVLQSYKRGLKICNTLVSSTFSLKITMQPCPSHNKIAIFGEVADYLKLSELTIYRPLGPKNILFFKLEVESRHFIKIQIERCIGKQPYTPGYMDIS